MKEISFFLLLIIFQMNFAQSEVQAALKFGGCGGKKKIKCTQESEEPWLEGQKRKDRDFTQEGKGKKKTSAKKK